MTRSARIPLLFLGLLAVMVAVTAFLVTWIDVKDRVEAAASEASGLQIAVGDASLGLLPALHLTATEVRVGNGTSEIATAGSARVGLAFWPLLRNEVRIDRLTLDGLTVSVERNSDGTFNFTRVTTSGEAPPAMGFDVTVTDGSFRYVNLETRKEIVAMACDLESNDLQVAAGSGRDILKNAALTAEITCGEVRNEMFTGSDVKATVSGEKGFYTISPLTMTMLGGAGSGKVEADFTASTPRYHIQYAVERLALNELFASVSPAKQGEGAMNFTTDLTMRGADSRELISTASGEAALHGENLGVAIGDLDEKLSRYEDSQNFNLVDVGAFFIAGPLGTAVTKGYNFASVFKDTDGTTQIRTLVSHWKVENGVARADDVAFATNENRLAMKGSLNFVTRSFEDVTVAVLDEEGCARIEQRIRGPFDKPDIVKPNVLASLAGPIASVIDEVKELVGVDCEVFYEGTVGR